VPKYIFEEKIVGTTYILGEIKNSRGMKKY